MGISFDGDEVFRTANQKGNLTNRSTESTTSGGSGSIVTRKVVYSTRHEPPRTTKLYDMLHTLDFDSERKRMSVIVYDRQRREYVLFCKGADSTMLKRCACKTERTYDVALRTFAESGWRVIVLAFRVLSESEYMKYDAMLADATADLINREAKLVAAFDAIEMSMNILGVTAVEDRLQEDVEITLDDLRQAGIKIWVLTGDKVETAINISESCRHFSSNMVRKTLTGIKNSKEIEENLSEIANE